MVEQYKHKIIVEPEYEEIYSKISKIISNEKIEDEYIKDCGAFYHFFIVAQKI